MTRERRFSIGDTIVKEGDDTLMGHYFMMVRKGTVECTIQSDDGEQVLVPVSFSLSERGTILDTQTFNIQHSTLKTKH